MNDPTAGRYARLQNRIQGHSKRNLRLFDEFGILPIIRAGE